MFHASCNAVHELDINDYLALITYPTVMLPKPDAQIF